MSSEMPSGWYSDAEGKKRYWNGEVWSDFKFEGPDLQPTDDPLADSSNSTDSTDSSQIVEPPIPAGTDGPNAHTSLSIDEPAPLDAEVEMPSPRHRRRRLWVGVIALVVVLLLAGGGAWWKFSADAKAAQIAATEKAADEKQAAEEKKDRVARAQRAADAAERAARAEMIAALEASIVEDATQSVADGFLDGPILDGLCTATGGGSTDDLTSLTGTFECIAVTKVEGSQSSGYAYSATIDWSTGSYTWHLGR